MADPNQIDVVVDRGEYSQYEGDLDTILVTVVASGGAPYSTENVVLSLVKASRTRTNTVYSKVITLSSPTDPYMFTESIRLKDVLGLRGESLVRHGEYFVRVELESNPLIKGESSDFRVSMVSADRIRDVHVFGLDLSSSSKRSIKYPSNVPGISVIEISSSHPFGPQSLVYTYTSSPLSRQLSWAGGTPVTITAPGTYVLYGDSTILGSCSGSFSGGSYIVVLVSSLALLPTSDVTSTLIVEPESMKDSTIHKFVDEAVSWVENVFLQTYVEPTRVTSYPDQAYQPQQYVTTNGQEVSSVSNDDYDFLVAPVSYFSPPSRAAWLNIQLPFNQLIEVKRISGVLVDKQIIDIPKAWINETHQGGLVQLVPYSYSYNVNLVGLQIFNVLWGARDVPNFWHYDAVVGLMRCPDVILELISRKTAMGLLTAAGAAKRPGVSSTSISRDGVSESVSYVTGSKYGLYTGQIQSHMDWIEENKQSLRAKYRGLMMRVM